MEEEAGKVLLHACCAPCSSAIVEWMLANGVRPTIFYYNPNIFPREEYEIRKQESKRHAEALGLTWIDGDYDHEAWREVVCGLEGEPERGRRCEQCFTLRLTASARKARELGLRYFTTTLASSRWKSLAQIEQAGLKARELGLRYFTTTLASSRWKSLAQIEQAGLLAEKAVAGTTFWDQNWRKGGLYERRNQLLKEFDFYNQKYCGCEFSLQQREAFEQTR